ERAQAETANYPFTTIEPNSGRVNLPDARLDAIAAMAKSETIRPTQMEFVDIAGLVKGASTGEGLGNRFLGNIREVEAILHVLRCFEDGGVAHVEGSMDPVRDAQVVETELMLADLESLEGRLEPLAKKARAGEKEAIESLPLIERCLECLRDGRPVRNMEIAPDEVRPVRLLHLLTAKPVLYVANVEEEAAATGNDHSAAVEEFAKSSGASAICISANIEAEIAQLSDQEERAEFLASLDLTESGLDRLIHAGYELLGLITFFTAGPNEARAWTVARNTPAEVAAGNIHSDFQRGFIAAETIAHEEYLAIGGEQAAKEAGKMRSEGREYIVQDGDIILLRFNV
ncbi:MAG: redox-regulated ATPase YchF, partial [Rhodospirillales bacterium]|nr:redox-regulated ATPase YchF [Rhodospirillales bacterium]